MSEKLKTFIVDSDGGFTILYKGRVSKWLKLEKDHKYDYVSISDGIKFYLNKKCIIKLFNLDLEVEDEA